MIRPDSLLIRFGTFAFSTAFNTALVILLVVAPAASTGAKTWECGERSNLPQEGKNYCAAGDFRQSKVNLAKVYNSMLDQYIAAYGNAEHFIDAQSAFESYRDNQCAAENKRIADKPFYPCLLYTSPSPRDATLSRMPSSA